MRHKMTCAMKLDYSEAEPHSLVVTQLCPEARHMPRRMELCLDAADGRNGKKVQYKHHTMLQRA